MTVVSVPLRGNDWERISSVEVAVEYEEIVSVPLRGNDWESRDIIHEVVMGLSRFRPLAGK